MAMFELSMVTSTIVEMGAEATAKKLGRRETVIRILKRLNIDAEAPSDDFEAIYVYALIEFGVLKPEAILDFFCNEFVREAFRQSFYRDDPSILDREAENIIEWNEETGELGRTDYDPRREFAGFSVVFNEIVDRTRRPTGVERDHRLEEIVERLEKLNTLDEIRDELAQRELGDQSRLFVPAQPAASIQPVTPPSSATSPSDTAPRIRPGSILIVTATKTETRAVLEVFSQAAGEAWTRQVIGSKTYYYLGTHGGALVYMVQSEPGTAVPGGALMTVRQAMQDLRPQAAIMCGFAFGLRPDKQRLGDILVAKQLLSYEPQKVDLERGQMPRGDRTTSAERLLDRFRSGDIDWQGAKTHFGPIVSGEKLVNDPAFRDWLLKIEPEAIGGEMEGTGLYVAARDAKVEWILVKAICDWGDGSKNDAAQPLAARNAAQFVLHVLQSSDWSGPEQLRLFEESVSRDIQKLINKTHLVLDGINDKLGDDFFLPRGDVDNDFGSKFPDNKLIIFKGVAGGGKSAYAKSVVSRLQESNYSNLAFKADSFAKESIEQAFPYLENDLSDILTQFGQSAQTVILIDSLEKLLEVDGYEALREFLRICRRFSNIRILVTCRSFAYQQLIFELHHDFPKYDFIDVPVFDDQELAQAEARFPFLECLLHKDNFREILRRPFYLNLVILHAELFVSSRIISEKEFRRLVWDEIISKHNSSRGSVFESIALQRAITMSLYARIENADPLVIKQLYNDGIILIDEELGEAYTPSHDMYEDIALIRFIERIFQGKQGTLDFFERLGGKEPAKLRAFRLWLNDQLVGATRNLAIFVSEVLEGSKIEQYWKDEVIIAILRSEYCQNFFDSNQELLDRSGHALLLRFIHLLRTACQEPDEQLIQEVQRGDRGSVYEWLYLRPVGPGWQVMLSHIQQHLDGLRGHGRLILGLVAKDWSKKLTAVTDLPPEAQAAGRILLKILDDAKHQYSSWSERTYPKKDVDEAIRVLFNLCSVFREETRALIIAADTYDHTVSRNYDLRDFYGTIIEYSLSGLYSREICKEFPELVCDIALKNWLRHEPTEHWESHGFDIEDDFGLTSGIKLSYFPAGIYRTPTRFLLSCHPIRALQLIMTVLNHATNAYAESERGKRSKVTEVTIHHEDGSITTQRGNAVLWGMYRGTIETTPYLLQSILMSLENWLLELCQLEDGWASRWIEFAFGYLLKNSTTVATTAVLASVTMAHPKAIGKLCLPILKTKEFYSWDLARFLGDQHPLAPYDNDIPFAQAERHRSNQLPHREHNLETLMTNLQIGGYWEETNEILGNFQSTAEEKDTLWRLALNRMDIRKYEVDESIKPPAENQILIRPKIDEDLVEVVEESRGHQNIVNKALGVTNWARKVYEDEEGVEKSLEKWRQEYQSFHEIAGIEDDYARLFGDPTYLAAVGVQMLHSQLTKDQLDWCVDIVLGVLTEYIIKNINRDHLARTTLYLEPAIETVPLILSLQLEEEKRKKTKEVIFLSLLHLTEHEMEYPFESIRNALWGIDEGFAHSCLAGMIEYAKLHNQRRYYFSDGEEKSKYLQNFFEQEEQLVSRVCDDEIEVDIEDLSFDTHSHWYLGFSAQIIPLDTQNHVYRSFIRKIFHLLFQTFNDYQRNDKADYFGTRRGFQQYLAHFLLSQPKHDSQDLFSEILDRVFVGDDEYLDHDVRKFIKEIVEQIIIEEDKAQTGNLWHLWEVLESKIKTTDKPYLISCLFLSLPWWNSDADDWVPLKGRQHYFRRVITELGHKDIGSAIRLLAGIGAERLLPDGMIWMRSALDNTSKPLQELSDSNAFFYCEKLIQRAYYRYLKDIKAYTELRRSYLRLLDDMINLGSSLAFIIRERIISI